MSLLIAGTVAFDTIETPFGKVTDVLGGSGTYAAVAASFFTPVNLVSVVGNDFPKSEEKFLKSRSIDVKGITRARGRTFRWGGSYEFDLNQAHTKFTELNVLANYQPSLPPGYKKSKYIFLANLDPVVQREVIKQLEKPEFILIDTMNFWIQNSRKELIKTIKMCHGLVLNDAEARELAQEASLIKAGRRLLGHKLKMVIIKKGEHGALLFTKDNFFAAPSFPLEELRDPTGAGDTFAGALGGYLAKTQDLSEANLRKAIITGTIIASFNVEDFSLNRMKKLTKKEISSRYEELRQVVFFE
jgi:sugar/nucleoside kinase (ribokinase family)